ncbi:MAG TPA: wax ester/triacylglycerol synthase family O-acyltransferase [Solirubrobacteraceae bacterium]|nr:wax ester/triacylglycerol synthase family O-acyltransferase [Solirubrobacteraceae bacterium]
MTDPLSPLDATFLELEQMNDGATMHIGGIMVFDPLPDGTVPTLDAVCTDIVSRLTLLRHYSQRLSSERAGGLTWPRWRDDPQFDIRNHVQHAALPAPGGDDELCEWAGDFFSHRLDRTRPLWEMVLLEGLADGRWALAHRTHHCLVDGVGSVDVAQLMLDPAVSPSPSSAQPPADQPSSRWQTLIPHSPDVLADLATTGVRATTGSVHAALHPRETLERSRSLAELIVRDELIAAPHTSLNLPTGATRRFDIVRASLPELKAIKRALGGSVNDVVLAACTTGLRQLLLSRGEQPPPEGIRAMVPVNIRTASQQLALGNRISSLFVELPVAEPDALTRVRSIVERTSSLKASGAALGAATMIDLAALAPPLLHALAARALYATRLFNLTITNVPGPRIPLYAFGAELREIHPMVPLAAEHAVGVAVMSYNGGVVLGLSADRDSTSDLGVLTAGVQEGFAELRLLSSEAQKSSPKPEPSTKPKATTKPESKSSRTAAASRASGAS